ncbi:hypothetical protein Gasu2_52070 [Galdieria sulphuraria]|uniref:Uncharacterized protein n=1 Tax=Galdieria sulphuraria TaxID=130081 RepID=M2XXQ7_GALSU|nr:uncharacterized protein Gasu_42270 [Galdieria sulphuraria]EME28224.1 hypothetical protein Gasu_42270 [Galdieria sulphuraria]GJD11051.1 hypothetical protein Gasu2_52070 [Galdieria sulphuraria]|eukprot:XP_005704744.1 hypothetical protein Gasu_42270 [Galdieria sulphuraria]
MLAMLTFVSPVFGAPKKRKWFSKLSGKQLCCFRCVSCLQVEQPSRSHPNYWRNIAREVNKTLKEHSLEANNPINVTDEDSSVFVDTTTDEREEGGPTFIQQSSRVQLDSAEISHSNSMTTDSHSLYQNNSPNSTGMEEEPSDYSVQFSTSWNPNTSWLQFPDLVESADIRRKTQEISKHQKEDVFKYYIDSENNLRPFHDAISPMHIFSKESETQTVSEPSAWENWHQLSQKGNEDSSSLDESLDDEWSEIDRWRPVAVELEGYNPKLTEDTSEEVRIEKNKLSKRREAVAWQKWFSTQQYNLSSELWERRIGVTGKDCDKNTSIYKQWLADMEQGLEP